MLKELLYILNGLVQEKEIVLSPTLFSTLEKMDNKVADFILKCATDNEGIDIDMSFFDISQDDGMVSFLKNRWDSASVEDNFTSSRREKVKIGRLVTALSSKHNITFSNAEVEEFINKYKASQKMQGEEEDYIKLVRGEEIKFYYNYENYQSGGGLECSLYKSCMRHNQCSEYFSVYVKNPNVALCVLLSPEKKVEARAIVWFNTIVDGKPGVYMDRIYSINGGAEVAMKEYAIENNWWFRTRQTSLSTEISNNSTILDKPNISALLPKGIAWDDSSIKKPYMDTLCYLKYVLVDNDVQFCLANDSNEWYQTWDAQNGLYDGNRRYVNPYAGLIKISQMLNVPISKIKKLNEGDDADKFEYYDVDGKCYRYVNDMTNYEYGTLLTENPHIIDEVAGSIENFQNGRGLIVDIKPEIAEYVSNNLEEVFYQNISLNIVKELLRANDINSNKELLKILLNKHFGFFKKYLNKIIGGVVVLPSITKLFDEIGNDSSKKIIGRLYQIVPLEKNYEPPTSLNGKYKKSDWIRIRGDYSDLYNTPIPKQYVQKVDGFFIGDKNKESINTILNSFDDAGKQIIIFNVMADVIFSKYKKNAILKRDIIIGDRVIVTNDDQSRRSVPDGNMGDVVELNGVNEVDVVFYNEVEHGSTLHSICEDGWGKVIRRSVINPIDKEFKLSEIKFLLDNSDKNITKNILVDVLSLHSYKQLIKLFDVDMEAFIENVDMNEVVDFIIHSGKKSEFFNAISADHDYKYDPETNSLLLEV